MKNISLVLLGLLLVSNLARASESCLQGTQAEQRVQAVSILQSLMAVPVLPDESTHLRAVPRIYTETSLSQQLGKIADHMNCEFSDGGTYITVGDMLDSMVNHFYKRASEPGDEEEENIKPGFKMALVPTVSNGNFVFAEVTENGFIFRVCGKDDKDYSDTAVYPSEHCRLLLSPGMFIPVHQMLHSLNSFQHMGKMFLRAVGQTSVVVTSSLSLGIISPVAGAASNFVEQDSMAKIKRDFSVYKMMKEAIKLAAVEAEDDQSTNGGKLSTGILTGSIASSFDDLIQALSEVTTVMIAHDFKELKRLDRNPGNPSLQNLPGLKIKRSVFKEFNRLYREGKVADRKTP